MRVAIGILLSLAALTESAEANPRRLPTGLAPRTLHMRGSAWMVAAAEPSPDAGESLFDGPQTGGLDVGAGDLDRLVRHRLEQDVELPPKPLSERLTLRFNLGMGLDGGQPSGEARLTGSALDERADYERLRLYSFGDGVIGSRGLGMEGLNGYLAAHFRYNQAFAQNSTALPSLYDRNFSQPLVRSAYVEVDESFSHPLLAPLHVRAGRSFQYGIAPFPFDGLSVGYHTRVLRLSVYGGQRVSQFGLGNAVYRDGGTLAGWRARADLYEWRKWPLVLSTDALRFDGQSHFRTGLAMRWNRDVLLGASLRTMNGNVARSAFSLAARLSEVTTVNVQLHRRTRNDWSFGLWQISPGSEGDSRADARRYLDLGPVLPRTNVSVRYGTVLLRNIDLLIRGAGAIDGHDDDVEEASSMSASFAEAGAALELQFRRAIRLGAAAMGRRYFLDEDSERSSTPGSPDPLASNTAGSGVASFLEGGLSMVYSPGARLFRGSAEFYGRRYRYSSEYLPDSLIAFRSGGRFAVEGWVGKRVRMRAEYDVTLGPLLMAPELRGLKTLRVLLEGAF